MPRFEFFFDCSSPWTYLAFERVQPLAAEIGVPIVWRPILVGGVFNAVNDSVYEGRKAAAAAGPKGLPPKLRYYGKDLQDWARFVGIRIGSPKPFPVNSVKAMRGCFVAEEHGKLPQFARAVFRAYWGDERDISQDAELAKVVDEVGLPREELFAKIATPAYKDRLRANTDDLIARGGFGSPTMFVDGDDMYFGNDRLELVLAALRTAERGCV
jgi:2-hydroxychromene-2-carboxylate isomerase